MAGTADALPDLTGLGKAEQLAALRRSMASIPGRRDHAPTEPDDAIPFTPSRAHTSDAPTADELDAAIADDEVRRTLHTITENQRVRDAALAIRDETPRLLGALLDASQASLRDDYGISTTEIDLAVETALASGALGARMLGRPYSGVAVALVDTDTASRVRVALDGAFAEHALGQPTVTEVLPSLGALRDR